ncbi:recombination protein RecR [Desulfobulbus propionicus DSM 2032]|jgi:recombination protein RecR|uniref:Recombination protein RecR n=1 Tax=Desulfobulbus propionicus (strain ATCC 33891 / DSM 2032 / VKM B-1956 / 1pr3) TaxID=577650 RepID=A0A7U3YMF1_DESPD|nr:recombination mediator RecR [Desulfobulbus propionicus]ADW18066.1 recombination protein RecR [Desulfobulbus propionicus DSM 2032]
MQIIPPALERLIADLTRLPGIGRKTATRLALYILRRPAAEGRNLAHDLMVLHDTIHLCHQCFTFSETDPCAICGNPGRDSRLVCVVEEPGDQIAIEKTGVFRGTYHILHGVIAPMDGIGPDELKIRELRQRVASGQVDEVLIATSSTVPGEATASYLAEMLQDTKVRLSRLACGIPMGMDIKYADEHTLARAVESRQSVPGRT